MIAVDVIEQPRGILSVASHSFVPQSLNRIQPRGAQSRNHAANQSHGAENERGRDQRSRSDDQADIAGFPVLGKGAVQSKPSHGKRNRVGQYHSQYTADKGNGEGLSEKLGEDVPALRASRLDPIEALRHE